MFLLVLFARKDPFPLYKSSKRRSHLNLENLETLFLTSGFSFVSWWKESILTEDRFVLFNYEGWVTIYFQYMFTLQETNENFTSTFNNLFPLLQLLCYIVTVKNWVTEVLEIKNVTSTTKLITVYHYKHHIILCYLFVE